MFADRPLMRRARCRVKQSPRRSSCPARGRVSAEGPGREPSTSAAVTFTSYQNL
jgi:hypothetical protein